MPQIKKEGLDFAQAEAERRRRRLMRTLRRRKDQSGGYPMNDCQGRGTMTREGEHVATVEYALQSEPDAISKAIHGDVEIVECIGNLSVHDHFTLHMEGSLQLDLVVEEVTDQFRGKYHFRGVGAFRKTN